MPWPKGKPAWNKGKTKSNLPGLARVAAARRLNNNLAAWQAANRPIYQALRQNADLAEFYGTMLGDGCIEKFPRTEKLVISFNSKEIEHIRWIAYLTKRLFKKSPAVRKRKAINCVDVYLYQKNISSRLKFPTGKKKNHDIRIPGWVSDSKQCLIRCLKGLFETDGSWVIDPTYNTNCISYTSIHINLLKDIQKAVTSLGFHPTLTTSRVVLSRRTETSAFAKLIKFRQY